MTTFPPASRRRGLADPAWHQLIRPLVQAQMGCQGRGPEQRTWWTASGCHEFLFGAERVNLAPGWRLPLAGAQDGECFYCAGRLARAWGEVDHFIPWSRHPDNSLDNLVAAHASLQQRQIRQPGRAQPPAALGQAVPARHRHQPADRRT